MTQYAVLNYYNHRKIAQTISVYIYIYIYISLHKLTWTTSRFNSSGLAVALKVGLENMP